MSSMSCQPVRVPSKPSFAKWSLYFVGQLRSIEAFDLVFLLFELLSIV
jgi:hypothetical protein